MRRVRWNTSRGGVGFSQKPRDLSWLPQSGAERNVEAGFASYAHENPDPDESKFDDDENEDKEPAVRRGRGRPRKEYATTTPTQNAAVQHGAED